MSLPPPDVDVTETVVRALLRAQAPELAHLPLTPAGEGWDNVVFRLGREHVVRLPRREVGGRLMRHEHRALPVLAPRLSVAAPTPVVVGEPAEGFPYAWSVSRWVEGETLDALPVAERRGRIARQVADAVRALHVAAPDDAPRNDHRGVPVRERAGVVRERLASPHVVGFVGAAGVACLHGELDAAAAAPDWARDPLWLHGDLHPRNLIASQADDGAWQLAAVIDFGDVCSGDPASDLATAWMTFDAAGREAFRAALAGGYDDATWLRARGWAVVFGTLLTDSDHLDHPLRAVGEHTLAQVVAEA